MNNDSLDLYALFPPPLGKVIEIPLGLGGKSIRIVLRQAPGADGNTKDTVTVKIDEEVVFAWEESAKERPEMPATPKVVEYVGPNQGEVEA